MTMRIDVCITDPVTGAVVDRFDTRNAKFADMRIERVTASNPGMDVRRWETPDQESQP